MAGLLGSAVIGDSWLRKELIDVELDQYVRFAEMQDLSKLPRWPLSTALNDETTKKELELYNSQEQEFDNWLAAHHLN